MVKGYYTYRIRVANRDRVQVEKLDASRQEQGQPSGRFRYEEQREEIEPLLQAVKNNKLNDPKQTRSLNAPRMAPLASSSEQSIGLGFLSVSFFTGSFKFSD